MSDILQSLNSEQKAAVLATEGPVLINAGAGSGKTRVLTSRIALLLEQGIEPQRILALTFTRKAAAEMKDRISRMSDRNPQDLVMGTFHSVFIRFLRQYHASIGYPERFTIYDEDDSLSCIKDCINETLFGSDWKENKKKMDKKDVRSLEANYKPKVILSRISIMKNNMVDADAYAADPDYVQADHRMGRGRFSDIYKLYVARCYQAGAMDYDDILLNTHRLLTTDLNAFRDLALRFDYILVDEYQDTNTVQCAILHRLTAYNKNICVVGDDSQSIYAFRGARIENILDFKESYPQMQTFRLETNYRSSEQIVNAANRLIENNGRRLPKVCHANAGRGERIRVARLDSDREEAMYVGSTIADGVRNGMRYQDYAVLYRTNAQSRSFEDYFIRNKIPYIIFSGLSFYERMEVKDVLAFLKLAVNPMDSEAFKRAVLKPTRGFGPTSLSALQAAAAREQISLWDAATKLDLGAEGIKPKAVAALREFTTLIDSYSWDVMTEDAYALAKRIADETGIYEYYAKGDGNEDEKRLQNVDELLDNIAAFTAEKLAENPDVPVSLCDFLEDMALLSNAEATRETDPDCVKLMTVHSAKGLEFPCVFVVGAEESLFPSYNEHPSLEEIEEERRLFYVAMTRAMNTLHVCCAARRMRYGDIVDCKPSRFIDEMKGIKQTN